MVDTTITSLPTATGIDGSTDWFAVDRTSLSTTQKINRNTMLGISGSPVGTSDTQNITNKTLDDTNTVTLKDTLFTLQDDGDTTKQARFQLSGIATATTRTYTLPDASSTLADISSSQTFTNKELTSPVISGGNIDNTTITVDSIAGHTTSGDGTIYGMSVSGGILASAAIAGQVNTAAIQSAAVTPVKLATHTYIGVIAAASMTSTGNLSVTGIGFKPQLVRFTFLAVASATDASGAVGAMTASSQFWSGNASEGSSGSWRYSSTTHCFGWIARGDTPGLEAAFVSMDSGGFTVNITTASSSGSISGVAYEAYG